MAGDVLSAEQLAARIRERPGPVMFLDACAVLDVLRAAHRSDVNVRVVQAAAKLLHPAAQADHIWLTTTKLVSEEVEENREAEVYELGAKLDAIANQIARVTAATGYLVPGHPEPTALPHDMRARIVSLTDQLVSACWVFCGSDGCSVEAMNRVRRRRHPSPKPGKQQPKDCLIFEEFLELTAQLRKGGLSEMILFVTPNKNDYGDPIHGPIAEELAVFSARYVTNIAWAYDLVHSRAKSAP